MNYNRKQVGITGVNGFIGSQLYKRLEAQGAYINVLTGDVRDPETFAGVTYEYDYIFHFADPSSQTLFKRQPQYAADVTINGFLNAARAAHKHGAKLIYPSTGLLSQDRENEYARCKKLCEDIHLGENLDAMGLRIFATYGPGEGHKRDYASVPYLFARDMFYGKSPVVWGDGNQRRDFIFIDDVADAVLVLADEATEQIIDVGSGQPVSFNEILDELHHAWMINSGAKIPDAVYIERPGGYVDETEADTSIMANYFKPSVDLASGIHKLVKGLKKDEKGDSNHND